MRPVKINLIGSLDMLKFKNLRANRLSKIESGSTEPLIKEYDVNKIAKLLHPKVQHVVISEIIEENADVKTFILVPDKEYFEDHLAYFKAGSYVTVTAKIGEEIVKRAYSLSCSPFQAKKSRYFITVKKVPNGKLSTYLHEVAKVGDKLELSDPSGVMTYSSIRDSKNVIALAGGIGITPFLSMAEAIYQNIEDFNLTILYAVNSEKDISFRQKLDKYSNNCSKIKVIYVLKDDQKEGFEHGLITSDLISNYTKDFENYSIFGAGSKEFITYLGEETAKLNLLQKYVRFEGSSYYEKRDDNEEFNLEVHLQDKTFYITCQANEKIQTAFEKAGISVPIKCGAGKCGFCRSKLVSGEIYSQKEQSLRKADEKFNFFHPCVSYPKSNLVINIYNS